MKTVFITGVSRGIGLATAKKFLAEGWSVIGTSTSGEAPIDSDNVKILKLDLSISESVKSTVKDVKTLVNNIDVLINNAGALLDGDDEVLDVAKLKKTLNVNLVGTVDLTEQLLAVIRNGGHVINIGSMSAVFSGSLSDFDAPAYRISKAAINMYTKTLAERLKSYGVTVSSIDPGWVRTDMGGDGATRKTEDAARDIYSLATSKVETGHFWLEGKIRNW